MSNTIRLLMGLGIATGFGCESSGPTPLKHISPTDSGAIDSGTPDTGQNDTATPDTGSPDTGSPDTGSPDSGTPDTGTPDTGTPDTGTPEPCAPPLVLAGTARVDPARDWWGPLIDALVCRGSLDGSGDLDVALISEAARSGPEAWILTDLETALTARGVDTVHTLLVDSAESAETAAAQVDTLDAAILVPVSAGAAYDLWNDTPLERALTQLREDRSGGIGGLGEGAMLLAGSSLAGDQDYLSTHVMIDGHTTELDDLSDGGSALHDDFLPFVPDATVDVEMTGLGRLVRLSGALARRADEAPDSRVWGVGLDADSGLIIQEGVATVIGPGTVSLIRPTDDSVLERAHWQPLTWTALDLDRLTAGWRFALATGAPDITDPPEGAEPVSWGGPFPEAPAADWHVSGHLPEEESAFGTMLSRSASTFETGPGSSDVTLPGLLGILDTDFFEVQALNHEALYRALYDHIGHTGVLVTYQGRLEHLAAAPGMLRFTWNTPVPSRDDPAACLSETLPWRNCLRSSPPGGHCSRTL